MNLLESFFENQIKYTCLVDNTPYYQVFFKDTAISFGGVRTFKTIKSARTSLISATSYFLARVSWNRRIDNSEYDELIRKTILLFRPDLSSDFDPQTNYISKGALREIATKTILQLETDGLITYKPI